MMDLEKLIVGDILEKQLCSIDHIIEEAFLEHFGFLLRDVKDRENRNTSLSREIPLNHSDTGERHFSIGTRR